MIQAAVIDNGVVGLQDSFLNKAYVQYTFIDTQNKSLPDLEKYDLLVVPNGTDQIAMYRYKEQVRAFLDLGKTLFCFDGWFTDWLPGNRWLADNSKKTIDIRYHIKTDRYQLFEEVPLEHFIFSNGISGWWACGYIEPAPNAEVILEDTWGRAIMILDESTTPGTIFATASGPLGDYAYGTTDDAGSLLGLTQLYHQLLNRLVKPSISIQ
jgi:hypothetical protein